jgi:hypothetical protein
VVDGPQDFGRAFDVHAGFERPFVVEAFDDCALVGVIFGVDPRQ